MLLAVSIIDCSGCAIVAVDVVVGCCLQYSRWRRSWQILADCLFGRFFLEGQMQVKSV